MKLIGESVAVKHSHRGKSVTPLKSRQGYKDEKGQVYLPPTSPKRLDWWKKHMKSRGFEF